MTRRVKGHTIRQLKSCTIVTILGEMKISGGISSLLSVRVIVPSKSVKKMIFGLVFMYGSSLELIVLGVVSYISLELS